LERPVEPIEQHQVTGYTWGQG